MNIGINRHCKSCKENEKGDGTNVKNILLIKFVTKFGIKSSETLQYTQGNMNVCQLRKVQRYHANICANGLTMAVGRLTYVLIKGITSAPLLGAVTMRTSLVSRRMV